MVRVSSAVCIGFLSALLFYGLRTHFLALQYGVSAYNQMEAASVELRAYPSRTYRVRECTLFQGVGSQRPAYWDTLLARKAIALPLHTQSPRSFSTLLR